MKRAKISLLIIIFLVAFGFGLAEAATTNLSLTIKDGPLFVSEEEMAELKEAGIEYEINVEIINEEESPVFVITII